MYSYIRRGQLQIHHESVGLQKKLIFRIFRMMEGRGDSKRKADTMIQKRKERREYSD